MAPAESAAHAEMAELDLGGPDSPDSGVPVGSRFPSSVDRLADSYSGPIFELSQDYPHTLPDDRRPWEEIDYRTDPDAYLLALRTYAYEGNLPDWRPQDNGYRRWYHMPWMHVGKHPREATHGLTWELPSPPGKLSAHQLEPVQNWAIGLFNPIAGYTIGRVWPDASSPPRIEESKFAVGAVSMKLLFTSATPQQVPFLAGSAEWQANIHETATESSPKFLGTLRLLQIDIAVREARADSTTGWVFGTYIYDKDAPGSTAWEKMVPVGLMFGNDPDIPEGGILRETRVAKSAPAYARLGFGGRMNGPADNPESACLSCHATAQWRSLASSTPSGTWPRRSFWFRNVKAGDAFCEGERGLDYSLQMAVAVKTFFTPKFNPGATPVPTGPCIGLPEEPGVTSLLGREPAPSLEIERLAPASGL